MNYSFSRYLAAKRVVDDRSLNGYVWETLRAAMPDVPLEILEVGAGTGTMISRLADRGLLAFVRRYTAVDADPANVTEARGRPAPDALAGAIEWHNEDVYEFARRIRGRQAWNLLIAHAFLDLIDAPSLLPLLFDLMPTGGLFYFTINFDGLTVLEPPIQPELDDRLIAAYHQTMDERLVGGRPTGGSRAGRRLLSQIPAAGGEILAAGASDWIVMPHAGGYREDEAYFLQHILHFFESSLSDRPGIDPQQLAWWLAVRREQIERGELALIAHQIDLCGRVPG